MEINSFLHDETRLLAISNEIVQITFRLHNESDISFYIENNDLQEEIKQIIIAFVKFMDEDHIVDGEGYYLLCKKNIWNFGKNCVFYRNDQIIPPHKYKFNFELEFASQVINRNVSYDRGRNKSITDSNKKNSSNLRGISLDNFGTPKSSNNTVNQEMIQHMSTRASISPLESWVARQRATATEFDSFDSTFDNKQSKARFVESTPAALRVNRQRSMDNACITPLDNQRPVQKPVDSAYATLFNYRGSIRKSTKNAFMTPIDNRGQKSCISLFTNREYSESIQRNSKNLYGYQDNVGGTSRNPILVGETFEQTSRTSSIRLSQESFTGSNWPSQNSFETSPSLDSGLQKASGISKSPFQTLRQMSSISNGTDDFSNNSFGDDGELSMQNTTGNLLSNERINNRETSGNLEDNNFFSLFNFNPFNYFRKMFPGI